MKTFNSIAFYRKDLKDEYKETHFNDIEYLMFFITGTGILLSADLYIFVDDNGSSKIIKNRLGL